MTFFRRLSHSGSTNNLTRNSVLYSAVLASTLAVSSLLFIPASRANASFDSTVVSNPNPGPGDRTTTGTRLLERTYFNPPKNSRPRSGSRTTTGTRQFTCLGTQESAFAMLGPYAVVGQTVSSRPEFTWHLPAVEGNFPVTFKLLAPNEDGVPALAYTTAVPYTPGITSFQLPDEAPALVAGKEYRWQVVVECDPSSPARSVVQELSLERVAISAALAERLAEATTPVKQAIAYAAAGLWYDAIAAVSQASTPAESGLRAELLRDLAITESEQIESEQIESGQTERQNAISEIAEMSTNP